MAELDEAQGATALLDEDGLALGVPQFVGPDTLERWLVCALLATLMTRKPPGDPENTLFATEVFDMAVPGSETDIDHEDIARVVAEATEDDEELAEAFVSAQQHATAVRHQWRNRLGRWVDMPEGMASPGSVKHLKVPKQPQSPGTLYTPEQIKEAGLDKWPEKGPKSFEILGDDRDTAAKYRQEHSDRFGPQQIPYSAERKPLHKKIVDGLFAGKTKPEGRRPRILFTAGGTASGKTTVLDNNPELRPPSESTVAIDADRIKDEFDEYQTLRAEGEHYAASAVHRESGDVAAHAFLRALEGGYDIELDGTGDADPGEFVAQLQAARDHGYDVDVVYVNAPTDVAIAQAIKRADETGRYVPVPRIREIHAAVSRTFTDEVIGLDWLNSLDVFDQGDHIATWVDGSLVPLDRTKLVNFARKQEEVTPRGQARP